MRAVSKTVSMLGAARSLAWPLAVAAAFWLQADPAACARITAVRVGAHPGYTRVVLETDAPAEFEVVGAPAATPGEVTLRIAAESRARELAPTGPGAPAISLLPQADGTTLARIRAPGPLRVETQVLTAPPRLVLDLRPALGEAALRAPAPPPPTPELLPLPLPPPAAVETPPPTAPEVAGTAPIVESAPVEAPIEAPAAPEPTPPTGPEPIAAPAAIDAPPPVALPPVGSPPPRTEIAAPPVASAPPANRRIELRSLVVGLAAGIGLALVAFASRRRREEVVAGSATGESAALAEAIAAEPVEAAEPAAQPEPSASSEAVAAPEPAPAAEAHDASLLDVLHMHQRLDARLAEIAGRLAELAQRQARLEARTGAETEEIASQRAAIARLQRSLRPAAPIRAPRQVP